VSDDSLRVDIWLWRARFFKTRALAAAKADEGRIRLRRGRAEARIDKPSRLVRPGDEIIFAIASRVVAVRILALGARRGPPAEAATLYEQLGEAESGMAKGGPGAKPNSAPDS
jgi:ribosome-associated heat shock protein Hsp15